jgi:hypothetical protein
MSKYMSKWCVLHEPKMEADMQMYCSFFCNMDEVMHSFGEPHDEGGTLIGCQCHMTSLVIA